MPDNSVGVGLFLVLFLPPMARIFATLRLDEKEPKNQENFKLPYPQAGAARKIFGPTHKGSKGDCLGGQAFCVWGFLWLVAWFDALMVLVSAMAGAPQFGESEGCAVGIHVFCGVFFLVLFSCSFSLMKKNQKIKKILSYPAHQLRCPQNFRAGAQGFQRRFLWVQGYLFVVFLFVVFCPES
jgi:hypothetical protein